MGKHSYYRIVFRLASPLAVGSGENAFSDHDAVRHKDRKPFIPAASIAGVFRHFLDNEPELQDKLFGYIRHGTSLKGASRIVFYDADLLGDSVISVRDSVKLKHKVGVDGGKFDMEIVETGAEFLTYLEIGKDDDDCQPDAERLLAAMKMDMLRFGAKTARGYGLTEIISLKKMEFDFSDAEQKRNWLDFDLFDAKAWESAKEFSPAPITEGRIRIRLSLRQNSALSIREYTTDAVERKQAAPDYKQLTLRNGVPVIPGTSWAGAFRERYEMLAGEAAADHLFGYVTRNDDGQTVTRKSRIQFSESCISGYRMKNVTRNSIDRFSAKTKDAALYTEQTCYLGKTELTIMVPEDVSEDEKICLSAVILDLHHGYLSLGGLTSIGRGMFCIEQINVNGTDKTDKLLPEKMPELLEVNG